MTAPAYQSKSTATEDYLTSFTPAVPSGTADGDLLVAVCFGTSYWNTPSGWTSRLSQYNGSAYLHVFTKTAGAGESATTFSLNTDGYGYVVVYRITGADTSSPIDASGSATSTLASPSVTTTVDDTLVLHLFASGSAYGTALVQPSGDTALDLPSNYYAGAASSYKTQASAGATGAATWDDSSATSDQVTATLAIAPAAAAGVAYESMSTTGQVASSSLSPSVPTGTEPGDLLIAFGITYGTNTWDTPSGWLEIQGQINNKVWARIATASESTYAFTKSGSEGATVSVYRFSGVYQNTTLSGIPAVNVSGIASDTSPPLMTCPAVTSTADGCLILRLLRNSFTSGATATPTVPSGTTQIESVQYGTGNGYRMGAAYSTQSSAGTTGTADYSVDGGVSDCYTIAIRPATQPTISSGATLQTDLAVLWDESTSATVGSNTLTQVNSSNGTLALTTGIVGPWGFRSYQSGGEIGLFYVKNGTAFSLQAPFTVALWSDLTGGTTAENKTITLTGSGVDDIEIVQAAGSGVRAVDLQVGSVSRAQYSSWNATVPTLWFIRADGYGNLEFRKNGDAWQSGIHDAGQTYTEIRVGQITSDGMSWTQDEIAIWSRALSDDEADILYNGGAENAYPWRELPLLAADATLYSADAGSLFTTVPSVDSDAAIQQILPSPFFTVVDVLASEASVEIPSPGPLTTTPPAIDSTADLPDIVEPVVYTTLGTIDSEGDVLTQVPGVLTTSVPHIDAEVELRQIPLADFITHLDTIDSSAAIYSAVPGIFTTTLTTIDSEIDLQQIANAPYVTVVGVIDSEGAVEIAVPGVLTTSPPVIDAEGEIPDVLDPVIYTTLDVIDCEGDVQSMVAGILTTSLDTVDAEVDLQAIVLPPYITTVDVIDAECDIYAAVPGILTTTVGTVEAEAYIFSPFMQALSDVYRVYIANQTLTANVGTSSQFILNERTTSPYTGQLVDEGGDSITKSVLDACQLVVYDKRTRTIIRETRDAFDTIATNGTVSWEITPLETSIVSTTIPMGQNEPRIATFEFAWGSEDYDDYSLTFDSTLDSKAVTVTHAMHGLAVEDYVVFKDAPAVGGLEMDGVFVVGSVADANTYTVTHVKAATSTASSSGTVTVYRRPQVSKHQFEFQVKKAEVE